LKNKDDIIFELFGTIDEAQAHIGLLYESINTEPLKRSTLGKLEVIMIQLYKVSGSIFTKKDLILPGLSLTIENWIDEMDISLEPITEFILPKGSIASSQAHVARAVVRRLERLFVHWDSDFQYKEIRIFLNRLSDYLFTLARYLLKEED